MNSRKWRSNKLTNKKLRSLRESFRCKKIAFGPRGPSKSNGE